jgi:hypothetical protein
MNDKYTQGSAPYLGSIINNRGTAHSASRRQFLSTASIGVVGLLLPWTVHAASSQIHDLRGRVLINGQLANYKSRISPGDIVATGSDGYIVFVVGESAFFLRSRSELVIEKPVATGSSVLTGLLKLVSGALGATFLKGTPVQLRTANATIGIRGTGVYMETRGTGTYFCTCWGKTDISVADFPQEKESVVSEHHAPRMIAYKRQGDLGFITPATFETHTDAEMEMLEKCVNRRAPWVKR